MDNTRTNGSGTGGSGSGNTNSTKAYNVMMDDTTTTTTNNSNVHTLDPSTTSQQQQPQLQLQEQQKELLIPLSRRNSSFYDGNTGSIDDHPIPTNVCTMEQLATLPLECLSSFPNSSDRPIQHFHEDGITISTYALHPMMYSVYIILIMEGIERFAFYGINYTQTSYLTGEYNTNWNANMDAISASSYVSISVAVAYTTPFIGAYLADQLLGEYYTIILGIICFYLPGILLIALTTVPGLLVATYTTGTTTGSTGGENQTDTTDTGTTTSSFNGTALAFGLLVLWPTGTGIVKSVVNVFGAKQFHPLLQSSLIESYYVNFYMCINIGALIGGIIVPLMAQTNVTAAYSLPLILLSIGMTMFMIRSPRFVRTQPKRNATTERMIQTICCQPKQRSKRRKLLVLVTPPNIQNTTTSSDQIPISAIFRISLLVVPFNIVYSQMSTTFIVQGTVMNKSFFNLIDAACMNNADAIAVLCFGHVISTIIYPYLATQNIKLPTTYKFAIGSAFGAASIIWALIVEYWIVSTYQNTGERISILWQGISYILIGAGEIFAVSAAYEVAFKASPPEQKVLFSAVNLFCIGGLPSVICIILYQLCVPWFQNSDGNMNISHIREYSTAHINKYFWLLLLLSLFGTFINLLPCIRDFVESIEDRATDMIRTPKTPKFPPTAGARRKFDSSDTEESSSSIEEQLLASRRHQYYLKYGSGPSLYKHGSMRAGPAFSFTNRNDQYSSQSQQHPPRATKSTTTSSLRPKLNRKTLSKLYRSVPTHMMSATNVVMSSSSGQPMTMANALLSPSSVAARNSSTTGSSNSTGSSNNFSRTTDVIESSNSDTAIV